MPEEFNEAKTVNPATARARLRLALRAERAFGLRHVPAVDWPEPTGAPVTSGGMTAAAPAARPQPVRPTHQEPPAPVAGSSARPTRPARPAPAARPTVDLFGNPIKPKQADEPLPVGNAFAEPPPSRVKRIELLQALDEEQVKGCTKCPLCEGRTQTVFGEGDAEARLMFVGEGPGENEDLSGRPFVGRAGELLDKMINAMGLERRQVYIANVVKCRPPGNRQPTADEIAACTPYLHKQIEWIRPQVIVTLGLPATRHLLGRRESMGKLRGNWYDWRGIKVMPTYHPAYLLRSYTPANRRIVWDDLRQVMQELQLPGPKS